MLIVDWSSPRIQKRRQRTPVFCVTCSECGLERWLSAKEACKAEPCRCAYQPKPYEYIHNKYQFAQSAKATAQEELLHVYAIR